LILTCSPTPSFSPHAVAGKASKLPKPFLSSVCQSRASPLRGCWQVGCVERIRRPSFREAFGDGYRDPNMQGKPFLSRSGKCLCHKAFSQISDFETMPRSGLIHRDT
jgi:hypothetical protein